MQFSSAEDFHAHLKSLKQRFDAMPPVLEKTFTDPAMNVEGYVVVWNTDICKDGPLFANQKGCGKGGTRIKQDLSLHDIKRLAKAMAEKNAAAGLPMGGAKSGINMSPDDPNYEAKFKRFVELVKESGILYEHGGVFGGFGYDIGCKPPMNALWAVDVLGSGRSFTGKPLEMGGTDYEKIGIAGYGVAVAGLHLIRSRKEQENLTFAVQGVGAMGGAVLKYFSQFGFQIKSLSDPRFGGTWVFDKQPSIALINNPTPEMITKEAQKVSDDPSGALYADVDIIFPCALEDSLTADNADRVKARYVVEGANNPTTDEAHQIFFDKNILVAPDILSNAGGIIAAFVEMTESDDTADKSAIALNLTRMRISANIKQMMDYIDTLNVRPDLVADAMTYMNIFKGE